MQGHPSASPWYAKNPDLEKLFNRMAGLPLEYQQHIAGEICQHLKANTLTSGGEQNLKSLGPQTVLGMMNFHGPSYWFNRDSTVRQAVLAFPSLDPKQQQEMLMRIQLSVAMCDAVAENITVNTGDTVKMVIRQIFNRDISELQKLGKR